MKRQLIAQGYYSNTANCWTKFPVMFCGIFRILFCRIYLFIPQFLTKPQQFSVEPWLGNTVLEPGKGPIICNFPSQHLIHFSPFCMPKRADVGVSGFQ